MNSTHKVHVPVHFSGTQRFLKDHNPLTPKIRIDIPVMCLLKGMGIIG